MPDPVSQCGTIQIDAIAGINFGLTMQRKVVTKLPDEHMRQQAGPGEAAVDRQAGCRRLGDALAAAAGHFRTHMPGDAERPGHVFQYLGHVFAQTSQRAAAFRAGTGGGMFHHVARQVFRQRLTFGSAPPRLDFRIGGRRLRLGLRFRRCFLRDLLLEIADDQFELVDRASHLLRRRSEPLAQQLRQASFQLLDLNRLVLQSVARGFQLGRMVILTCQQQRPQGGDVAGQRGGIQRRKHNRIFHDRFPFRQVKSHYRNDFFSSRHFGTPGARRHPPIDALQQHRQLRRRQKHRAVLGLGPDEAALLEPLREQAKALPVPPQNLDQVTAAAAVDKKVTTEWVLGETILGQRSEAIESAALMWCRT